MISLRGPCLENKVPEKPRSPFGRRWRKGPDEWDKTIIAVSPYGLKDMVLSPESGTSLNEPASVQEQNFKIRLAHSEERVNSASMLLQRMYSRKGYDVSGMQKVPDRITLMASQNNAVVGTITLGIDSGQGLLADQNYKPEVDKLRAENRRVCEFTKLALDEMRSSKRVLAALFHIVYIYARVLLKQTDVVIEVTPKHALYYKKMLGFEQWGEERLNSRVNTMGVLLRLEFEHADQQIERWGGKTEQAEVKRSLYPYFFSKVDEDGITKRLLSGD